MRGRFEQEVAVSPVLSIVTQGHMFRIAVRGPTRRMQMGVCTIVQTYVAMISRRRSLSLSLSLPLSPGRRRRFPEAAI